MFYIEKGKKNNWKEKSEKYLIEIEQFLDMIERIKDEELRKELLMKVLNIDNELTLLCEKLFKEYYDKGYEDGNKDTKKK